MHNKYNIEIIIDIIKPAMRFDEAIKKYGYPVISKDVSKTIEYAQKGAIWAINALDGLEKDGTLYGNKSFKKRYKKYKYLLNAPFKISEKCCKYIKEQPIKVYEKQNDLKPIIGTIADESKRRLDGWLKVGCNAFDIERPRSTPLAFWTEQDILQYVYLTKLPISKIYGDVVPISDQLNFFDEIGKLQTTGESRTGCMFCMFGCHRDNPNKFQRMKHAHPKLYDYCIRDVEEQGLGLGKVLDYIGVKYD